MCVWEWKYRVCVYGNGNIEYVCMGMEILGMCVWEWKYWICVYGNGYVCMGMEDWVYVYGYIMYTCYIFLYIFFRLRSEGKVTHLMNQYQTMSCNPHLDIEL